MTQTSYMPPSVDELAQALRECGKEPLGADVGPWWNRVTVIMAQKLIARYVITPRQYEGTETVAEAVKRGFAGT